MLLDPETWTLAQRADRLLAGLGDDLLASCSAETHEAALELTTAPHATAAGAIAELGRLRERLARDAQAIGLATAAAGMHPGEMAEDPRVSPAGRYQLVQQTMRGIARREPTFALHVHIGVADAESAIRLLNRLRAHLPLLLALSASSPLWRGQATGLASNRTILFQAFPRTGLPRRFEGYADWARTVDLLLRSGAIPEPTFLWWDVRPQPRFGTVEVRIMDAQPRLGVSWPWSSWPSQRSAWSKTCGSATLDASHARGDAERLITLGDNWGTQPRRNATKPGEKTMRRRGEEVLDLQGESGSHRAIAVCLPCRRSWVRVPSAAWKALQIKAFLVPETVCVVRRRSWVRAPSADLRKAPANSGVPAASSERTPASMSGAIAGPVAEAAARIRPLCLMGPAPTLTELSVVRPLTLLTKACVSSAPSGTPACRRCGRPSAAAETTAPGGSDSGAKGAWDARLGWDWWLRSLRSGGA
jgi:YbdK family carboxylate-amine ligase